MKDEPVVIHCYTTPDEIENAENLAELGVFSEPWDVKLTKEKLA